MTAEQFSRAIAASFIDEVVSRTSGAIDAWIVRLVSILTGSSGTRIRALGSSSLQVDVEVVFESGTSAEDAEAAATSLVAVNETSGTSTIATALTSAASRAGLSISGLAVDTS